MRRFIVNAALAACAAATVSALYPLLVLPVLAPRPGHRFGSRRAARDWARTLGALLWLDGTLWLWHVANHHVPFLWRFHAVHHMDGDLDASTALRFHAGELALSTFYRALQVGLFPVDARTLLGWELAVLLSVQFHHSNLRLPAKVDRALRRVVATPQMHGVHHSVDDAERNSNFANLLTLWDRLFGTFRSPANNEVEIGLPGFSRYEVESFGAALTFPFTAVSRLGPARN